MTGSYRSADHTTTWQLGERHKISRTLYVRLTKETKSGLYRLTAERQKRKELVARSDTILPDRLYEQLSRSWLEGRARVPYTRIKTLSFRVRYMGSDQWRIHAVGVPNHEPASSIPVAAANKDNTNTGYLVGNDPAQWATILDALWVLAQLEIGKEPRTVRKMEILLKAVTN